MSGKLLYGLAGVLLALLLVAIVWLLGQGSGGGLGGGPSASGTNPVLDVRYRYNPRLLEPAPYDSAAEFPLQLDGDDWSRRQAAAGAGTPPRTRSMLSLRRPPAKRRVRVGTSCSRRQPVYASGGCRASWRCTVTVYNAPRVAGCRPTSRRRSRRYGPAMPASGLAAPVSARAMRSLTKDRGQWCAHARPRGDTAYIEAAMLRRRLFFF